MSNGINAPYGFSPYQYLGGAPWDGKVNTYFVLPGFSVSIFSGDPVAASAGVEYAGTSGYIVPWDQTLASTIPILGIFVGCKYIPAGAAGANSPISSPYWPASAQVAPNTPVVAMVVDDPYVIYKIQTDNSAAGVSILSNGLNSSIVFTPGTGNTATGSSVVALSAANVATTSTLAAKIVGAPVKNLNGYPGFAQSSSAGTLSNFGEGSFNDVLVMINNHTLKAGTTANRG